MKPEIRQTPEGIELYVGNAENFRAWPLTWGEATHLYNELSKLMIRRWWEHEQSESKGGE